MKSTIKFVSMAAVTLLLSECGTLLARSGATGNGGSTSIHQPKVYPATQFDAVLISSPFFLLFIIDLLFSIVTDTLMLPVDIYRMNKD